MQHQTPQFIEIEDKIIGPFTVKQFIFLAGGAGICALLFRFLPFFLFLVFSLPVIALSGALAFYKHNNRPFIELIEAAFKYITNTRLYLWRHRKEDKINQELNTVVAPKKQPSINPSVGLGTSKLKKRAWELEVEDDPAVKADE